MQFTKLQILCILALLAPSSAMAIVPGAKPHVQHVPRDHGNPFQPVPSPHTETTSIIPPATSEILAPATIAPSSSTFHHTIQPTVTTSLLVSSPSRVTSSITNSTSSSMSPTISTSSPVFTSSIALSTTKASTATAKATAIAIAPTDNSTSSSSQPTTLIILSVLSLIVGLAGLAIFILAYLRRQARRKRARGMKREVELLEVEAAHVVPGGRNSVGAVYQSKQGLGVSEGVEERKFECGGDYWTEGGEKGEGDDEWERGLEQEGELPAYFR